ncbi:MAG TPA: aldehyde dehydrogenase family protein [Planctomycetaceae bacterium]|nr:aldehyde dehydrogenase family protein [Planctomycetaceae bacterium]
MKMFLAGEWTDGAERAEVHSPFDGSVVDTVPLGTPEDITRAVNTLVTGAAMMRRMSAYDRSQILRRAADGLRAHAEDLAHTITAEEGKILAEARMEVARSAETLEVSAEEAKRVVGEMVPLDAAPNAAGKIGFTLRQPCGIVAAITPFNFPLNLVCHKVGPALAGGNAILIKPASNTPLSALKLVEILLEAGVPETAIACITGPGGKLGNAICDEPRIRKISFTGSAEVGEQICRRAGLKRVTMELGGNGPVLILDDADLDLAARAIAAGGYANAGQVCISAQRVLTSSKVAGDFVDALRPHVASIKAGNPLHDETKMGPMIRPEEAARVGEWIDEAVAAGSELVCGGHHERGVYAPTILDRVDPNLRVSRDELFGPAVAITRCHDVAEAIRIANDSPYGLAAAVFTRNLESAFRFARDVDAGNLHVNWSTQWRVDLMPYGGLKHSGLGKEGPKYALHEMTEEKLVVLHLPAETT